MNKQNTNRLTETEISVLEEQGWNATVSADGSIELETWSPLGEDIVISIYENEDLKTGVERELDWFDVDEHVLLWVDNRDVPGVPQSIRALVEDAEAIEEMLSDLAKALRQKEVAL